MSSVLPATTCGSTPSGSRTLLIACCILFSDDSMSVPYSKATWICARPSFEVDVICSIPVSPWKESSIGAVT